MALFGQILGLRPDTALSLSLTVHLEQYRKEADMLLAYKTANLFNQTLYCCKKTCLTTELEIIFCRKALTVVADLLHCRLCMQDLCP